MTLCIDSTKVEMLAGVYDNGRLGIDLIEMNGDPYAPLTVNLPQEAVTDPLCAFLDTNNFKNALVWAKRRKLGKPTGRTALSGFSVYPEFRFDPAFLKTCITYFVDKSGQWHETKIDELFIRQLRA